ncbi:hypothetical protein FRB99_005064 [Tulasnella sp. 403]|nr:hypothetical protein FRB99_005064 [Tulasnella sp. 403]
MSTTTNESPKPPFPARASTTWSEMSGSSGEDGQPCVGIPAIVSLFQDAARYGDVLSEEPESSGEDSETSSLSDQLAAERVGSESPDIDTGRTTPVPDNSPPVPDRIDRLMNDLMLNEQFKASTTRLVQLSVNTFTTPGENLSGLSKGLTSDTASDSAVSTSSEDTDDANDRVVPLLVKEFGPIVEEGEEERLLMESDGAYFQEVAIIGIIHLTTHRVTFHASLLSARPDMIPARSHIIKAGPVLVHREGLHRKRRVWLELSHDMFSTFPDSTDEGRVRPLRAVLLSDVKLVGQYDPADPKSLYIDFKTSFGIRHAHVEFDTSESASSWRQELSTALIEYRRRRSTLFNDPTAGGNGAQSGVRLALPLHRIESFDCRHWGSFATIVTFHLTPDDGGMAPITRHTSTLQDPTEPVRPHEPEIGSNVLTMTIIQNFDPEKFQEINLVTDTKLRFHAHDVNKASVPIEKRKCVTAFHRLVLQVKGHKEMTFSFKTDNLRDEAVRRLNVAAQAAKEAAASPPETPTSSISTLIATSTITATSTLSTPSTTSSVTSELASVSEIIQRSKTRVVPTELLAHIPRPINIPTTELYHTEKQHFVCLTIGSRGDVQPYIALCLGLKKEGHEVTIVTHEEYKAWVEGFGIQHRTAGGDPGALMKLSVEHKIFSPQFFKESLGHFRKWLDDLLVDSYEQVKASGATVLIESPSAMAGVHIAESLNIPYFRAFTMPWSRTAEYPHAFISPPDFIPFLYNFSPNVVPKPLDWTDTTIITGYWFLDNPDLGWKPAPSLIEFMDKARKDGKALVYIGFGSIVVEKPKAMTKSIVKAVLKSDVRAILNKGWSARMATKEGDNEPDVVIPPEVYEVDKIPHDWLFPQIDAALHHGGAGTTGASLRAGIPTLIKPWFGDQFFWASRVQKLGAGLRVGSMSSSDIAHALVKATTDRVIKEKAQAVGEKIREEDGVGVAIRSLYTYLHRAGIRRAHHRHARSKSSQAQVLLPV